MNTQPITQQLDKSILGWHSIHDRKFSHYFGWYKYRGYLVSLCGLTVSTAMLGSAYTAPACSMCREYLKELEDCLRKDNKDED